MKCAWCWRTFGTQHDVRMHERECSAKPRYDLSRPVVGQFVDVKG